MFDYLAILLKLTYDKSMRERLIGYRPVVVCVVSDVKNEKILLVKPAKFPELWILPQEGYIPGEETENAALRCLEEELGLLKNSVNFRRSHFAGRITFESSRRNERDVPYSVRGMVGKSYFAAYVSCSASPELAMNKSEIQAAEWYSLDDAVEKVQANTAEKCRILTNVLTEQK